MGLFLTLNECQIHSGLFLKEEIKWKLWAFVLLDFPFVVVFFFHSHIWICPYGGEEGERGEWNIIPVTLKEKNKHSNTVYSYRESKMFQVVSISALVNSSAFKHSLFYKRDNNVIHSLYAVKLLIQPNGLPDLCALTF